MEQKVIQINYDATKIFLTFCITMVLLYGIHTAGKVYYAPYEVDLERANAVRTAIQARPEVMLPNPPPVMVAQDFHETSIKKARVKRGKTN